MNTIFDVANFFLSKECMTHKKLQKLCWYAYSWGVFLYNDKIDDLNNRFIEAKFEAWVHGPVDPDLYKKYRNYGFNLIKSEVEKHNLSLEVSNHLEEVYQAYKNFSADDLEIQSHNELPWKNARMGLEPWENSNEVISDEDIFKEYSAR